jgi:putative nucleotidyltransferase with HDIG domain/PAS domain S-box-containing protein
MTDKDASEDRNWRGKLRSRAEASGTDAGGSGQEPSADELAVALHELRVHQIELEMQNEELRGTQAELGAIQEHYRDLYDRAPVGYVTLGSSGLITQANIATGLLFDRPQGDLTGTPLTSYICSEYQDAFYLQKKRLLQSGSVQVSELKLVRAGDEALWVRLDMARGPEGADEFRLVLTDISDLKRVQHDLLESNASLTRMTGDVVETMGMIVEARDPYTQGHQQRVALISSLIAAEMGLADVEVASVTMAALVHDIGKIAIPADILNKPGRLSPAEFRLIKDHSASGFEILKHIDFPTPVAETVLQHHERMDGSGYPRGLVGDEISVAARILAVADVVEAMAADRPYRPALGLAAAVTEIRDHPLIFDRDVIAACLALDERGELGRELTKAAHEGSGLGLRAPGSLPAR